MSAAASTLFTSRCPVCDHGPIFDGWLSIRPKCTSCGAVFLRDPGSWTGATVVSYMTSAVFAVLLILVLLSTGNMFDGVEFWIVGLTLVFSLVSFRFVKAAWVGILYDMEQVYADPAPDEPPPAP